MGFGGADTGFGIRGVRSGGAGVGFGRLVWVGRGVAEALVCSRPIGMAWVDVWVGRRRRAADLGRLRVQRMGGEGSQVVAEGGGSGAVRGRRTRRRRRMAFLFAENFELLTLEPQGFVPLFAAAQGKSHFDKILHNEDPAVERDLGRFLHILDHLREHGGKSDQEVFAGDVGEGRPGGLLGKVTDVFDAGAVVEPLLIGALAPLGQILRLLPLCIRRSAALQIEALPRSALLGDESVLKEPFHVMPHHRIGVEPTEDVFGGHVVHDLMIQLLADVEGETGDFTFAGSHRGGLMPQIARESSKIFGNFSMVSCSG